MQTPLGAFPQAADAMQLRPEGATRFAGYFRIVNEGAVRLEVVQASGLSQISPEQFPESDATRAALRVTGSQRFAYRFSGADFALRIQADQILPELSVSQVLAYHLGENELAIDAEIELDIREAPLRELLLRVPKGYAIARLTGSGLTDYFPRETDDQPDSILRPVRLVYGQPVSGRQVIQLRLERNQPLGEATWALPRVEVAKAKSVRGHVAVAADAGFRLTAERTQGLTEIATAFFPRKVPGIQAAFRLSDPAWQATLRVERLPQTVQADAFHLFSIGEGIAYGSSVMNYVVSGAPVSAFKVELSDEYFNVEFTGKDIRNWQKTDGGYVVQLHTPVSGAYTLAGDLRAALQGAGRDADLHRRAPARRAIRAGLHPHHQRLPVPGEARRCVARPAAARDRRSAARIPPVLRRAHPRRLSLHLAPVRSQARAQPAGAGRFAQPGRGPRVAHHAHLQGRPGAHRRALLREEPRQPALPPDAAARARSCGRPPSTAPPSCR